MLVRTRCIRNKIQRETKLKEKSTLTNKMSEMETLTVPGRSPQWASFKIRHMADVAGKRCREN